MANRQTLGGLDFGNNFIALQNELQESSNSSEAILRHVQDRKFLDTKVLKRQTGDLAVEVRNTVL